MSKRETVEDVIRMAVRVTTRMRRQGVQLHWTVTTEPCAPYKDQRDYDNDQKVPGKKR